MPTSVLFEIENKLKELSQKEQLLLIEKLVHNLRESILENQNILEKQLADMASDPEIQRELKKIEKEFILAESDYKFPS